MTVIIMMPLNITHVHYSCFLYMLSISDKHYLHTTMTDTTGPVKYLTTMTDTAGPVKDHIVPSVVDSQQLYENNLTHSSICMTINFKYLYKIQITLSASHAILFNLKYQFFFYRFQIVTTSYFQTNIFCII